MWTVICDGCGRQVEVPDSAPGTRVQCPTCGDWNIVRGKADVTPAATRGPASGRGDRAVDLGFPSEQGPETRVLRLHPVALRARPVSHGLVLVVIAAGLIGAVVLLLRTPSQTWWAAASAAAAVIGLGMLAYWKVVAITETLVVTTKRVTYIRGLLSRHTSEIPHEDVKNIQISQSLWQRIVGIGRVGISSAGQDDVEIIIGDVPGPYRVREAINAYRNVMD
ncbi:MAG: PH domain-containing protein [Phycisphaeraceae bacterium]|nr:PH domain-containing protein [Phycisphaeraceae bacterium]